MSLTGSASMTNELQGSVESGGEVRGKLAGLRFIQGLSAYETAVLNGFSGTEAEWLETLKGKGIENIEEIGSNKIVDGDRVTSRWTDYRITYAGGKTKDYRVYGGADGKPGARGQGITNIFLREVTEDGNVYNVQVGMDLFTFTAPKGDKGKPFTYEDFTQEQLDSLEQGARAEAEKAAASATAAAKSASSAATAQSSASNYASSAKTQADRATSAAQNAAQAAAEQAADRTANQLTNQVQNLVSNAQSASSNAQKAATNAQAAASEATSAASSAKADADRAEAAAENAGGGNAIKMTFTLLDSENRYSEFFGCISDRYGKNASLNVDIYFNGEAVVDDWELYQHINAYANGEADLSAELVLGLPNGEVKDKLRLTPSFDRLSYHPSNYGYFEYFDPSTPAGVRIAYYAPWSATLFYAELDVPSVDAYTKEEADAWVEENLTYDAEKWGTVTKTVVSENLITSPNVTWAYSYLVASDGTTPNDTDQNWKKTVDYFPVSPGDVLEIKNSMTAHTSVAMFALYDKNKAYIRDDSKTLVKGDFVYTIPKDSRAAYVKFSLGNKIVGGDGSQFYTQELYITNAVPISTPKENIDNIYSKIQQADHALSLVKNPLEGKIVFLAGDSRSSTDYDFYKSTIEEKCGCIALVQGASGRNVAYNASNAYFDRLTANPHDFSLWIVGGNDTGAAGTIGTFNASSVNGVGGEEVVAETDITADYNGTKFVQAIDHMMRKYKSLFYDFKTLDNFHVPKMIFCTDLPQQRNNATSAWSIKENWERKRNAIIECCEKNNVACLDLYKLCNFDMSFEPYWVSPTDKVNDNGLYFMDGLHPNKFGIDIITSLEIEEMKKYIVVNKYEKVRQIVRNGLVMYCDGIDNTGNGHSNTTTTWADLSGNGNNLINVASTTATTPAASVNGEWTANGMHIITKSNQFLRTVNTFDMGADRTLEMRVTLNVNDNMAIGFKGADRVKFRADGAAFWVRVSSSDQADSIDARTGVKTVYNTPVSVSISRAYDSAANATTYRVYVNGDLKISQNVSGNYRSGESAGLLFGMESDNITMHSVRVYNRALTDSEVKENHKFDMLHFDEV